MFRRFSLFDSSPPTAKISINPPKSSKGERKSSPLKTAIIESLQIPITKKSQKNFLINSYKRSKSLDNSSPQIIANDKQTASNKQRTKSATLPPIIANRSLPQSYQTTTDRWFNKIGVPHRRSSCAPRSYRSPFCYHVRIMMPNAIDIFNCLQARWNQTKLVGEFIIEKVFNKSSFIIICYLWLSLCDSLNLLQDFA